MKSRAKWVNGRIRRHEKRWIAPPRLSNHAASRWARRHKVLWRFSLNDVQWTDEEVCLNERAAVAE